MFLPARRSFGVDLVLAADLRYVPSEMSKPEETRALSGDRAAWDALIARHDRRIVVSLLARGLPIERAKELAHETWISLFARRAELTALRLPGLAITQARFLAADELRRQGRAVARAADERSAERVRDPRTGGEDRLLRREELARAQAALATLTPSARRVFELLYDRDDVSHREAGELLGLSEQRVRQVLCEVRRTLREAIEE
jgi:RNA polymerase sigma-70 factor (ECF subfamily)